MSKNNNEADLRNKIYSYSQIRRNLSGGGPDVGSSSLEDFVADSKYRAKLYREEEQIFSSLNPSGLLEGLRLGKDAQKELQSRQELDYRTLDWQIRYDAMGFGSRCKDLLETLIKSGDFTPDGEQIDFLIEMGIDVAELLIEQQVAMEQETDTENK